MDGVGKYVGDCIECHRELHNEGDGYYADDYVETEDGLVCWDCWLDYGRRKKFEQEREGRRA